jgi:hypothetical protein
MLLRLTTVVAVFLVWVPVAHSWSWPVQGPVLQPFAYDEAHPYAAGQHRGIDIGADSAGENVLAPAAGTVSFAGFVPTSGQSVTIETADGYSVTLTHLGSLGVSTGATVDEGAAVGTIGPSGTPEFSQPYLHLGIRLTADPNGYRDPLQFLPPVAGSSSAEDGSTSSQPSTSGSSAPAPAKPPQRASARANPRSTARKSRTSVSDRGHGTSRSRPATQVRTQHPSRRSGARPEHEGQRLERPARTPHHPVRRPTSAQRPVVEATAPVPAVRLDAGHEIWSETHLVRPDVNTTERRQSPVLSLALDGAAALLALAAAFAAARGRRRRDAPADAQVLPIPQRRLERLAA